MPLKPYLALKVPHLFFFFFFLCLYHLQLSLKIFKYSLVMLVESLGKYNLTLKYLFLF